MKNLLYLIFRNFWLVFSVIVITGILDLIFITTFDFGIGFVAGLLYLVGYIIYFSKQ